MGILFNVYNFFVLMEFFVEIMFLFLFVVGIFELVFNVWGGVKV